ncbi:transcription termination factor Rho [bacterium]|nr:MAG: transcription termination factor Rho [bacterium]
MRVSDLEDKTLLELRKVAQDLSVGGVENFEKKELILKIVEEQVKKGGNIFVNGFLEIVNDNSHGILHSNSLLPGENDVYISSSQIRRFNLRKGDFVTGQARAAKEGERYLSLLKIEAIDGVDPEKSLGRPTFEKLTPIFPDKQIKLETTKEIISTRIIDLLAPIGNGQRGMIVAPPKSGKTFLLKDIALGVRKNYPEYHLMIVLIGERPEEVTDMRRTVEGAEVFASNFDESPQDQVKVAELALERAKRLVEVGRNVVILMDSLTRLARAYNVALPASGRTLSGGMDPIALYPAKRFYGAARNFEVGGSLTILATALVETGSRMDEVIFEEFKGTGNMELKLSRDLADKRVFPSIDIEQSGTRNEELLLGQEVLSQSWRIRRMMELLNSNEKNDVIIERMKKTKNNTEFLQSLVEG